MKLKKTLLMFLGLVATFGVLTACDNHNHSYAAEWSSNETTHWHASTCGHDVTLESGDHTWDNGTVTTEPTESSTGVKTYTCTVCSYAKTETIEKLNHTHSYGSEWVTDANNHWHTCACGDKGDNATHTFTNAAYTWASDYSTVTATRSCSVCGLTDSETATASLQVIEPTCELGGKKVYTATFDNAAFTTQTKEVVTADALGHDYTTIYTWNEDNTSCTALSTCHCSHTESETVETTVSTVDATCTAAGSVTYTATFANAAYETQTKTITGTTIPHTYGNITYVWATDYTSCTASKECSCGDKVEETGTITSTTNAATCTVAGSTTYTAVFATLGNNTKSVSIDALGHSAVTDAAVAPTCTTKGLTEGSHCSRCNAILVAQTDVNALGHTNAASVKENEVPATCTTAGSYNEVVYCSVCNAKVSSTAKTVDALGHTPAAAVEENKVASTCKVAGSYDEVVYCSVCNAEISRTSKEIAKLAHTPEVVPAVGATCTATGLTEGSKCSVCNEVLVAQTTTPALGHTNGAPVRENEVAATCTAAGSYNEVVYCSVCTTKLSTTPKTIEKLPHSYSADWSHDDTNHWHACECNDKKDVALHTYESEVITEATETVEGEIKHTCTVCEYSYIQNIGTLDHVHTYEEELTYDENYHWYAPTCNPNHEVKDKVAHNYVWETKDAATCTTPEVLKGTCACGHTTTKSNGEALGHTNAEAVKENEVPATCTTAGSYDEVVYCSVCSGEVSRNAKTIAALGHTPAEAVRENEVPATCKVEGSYEEVVCCSICEEELSRTTKEIAKLEHTPEVVPAVSATCTATGLTEGSKCSVCNEVLVAQTTTPSLGHTNAVAVKENEVPATCTTNGSYDEVVYCSVCEAEVSRTPNTIVATGHTNAEAVKENEVPATCTTNGSYESVIYCSVCSGEVNRTLNAIEATGHTNASAVKENEVPATCEAAGSYDEVVYCSVCSAEVSRTAQEIAKLAHTEVVTYDNGYKVTSCSVCTNELEKVAYLTAASKQNIEDIAISKENGVYTVTFTASGEWCGIQLYYNGVALTESNVNEAHGVYSGWNNGLGVYWSGDDSAWFVRNTSGAAKQYTITYTVDTTTLIDVNGHTLTTQTDETHHWKTCDCSYATEKVEHDFSSVIGENGYAAFGCECGILDGEPSAWLTYTGTYNGCATRNEDGTYILELTFNAAWQRITFRYGDEVVPYSQISGAFVNSANATWSTTLYAPGDNTLMYSIGSSTPYIYRYTPANGETEASLTVSVKGLAYGGEYYDGFAMLNPETGICQFELIIGQWKYITLSFSGIELNSGNTNITGLYGTYNDVATTSSPLYKGLYENATGSFMSATGAVYVVTYNANTNTLDISLKEDEGFFVVGTQTGSMTTTEIEAQEDGTYVFDVAYASAWKYVQFIYNGKLISKANSTINLDGTQYVYFDAGHNYRVYINANSSTYPVVYQVTYNPTENTVVFHMHSYTQQNTDEAYLATEADCTNAATYYYSCSCGVAGTNTFTNGDALGHTAEVVPAVGATCTSTGLTEGSKCSVCDEVLLAQTPTEKLDHNYSEEWSYDEDTHWHECSCTAKDDVEEHTFDDGVTVENIITYTCECGYYYTEAHTHEYSWTTQTAANCTDAEVLVGTCECGNTTTKEGQAALGHTLVFKEVQTAPTVDTDGFELFECSVCEETEIINVGTIPYSTEYAVVSFAALGSLIPNANDTTSEKFYAIGTIESVDQTTYGNFTISDSEGHSFVVYGSYSFDGSLKYGDLTEKATAGDTVVFYGTLKNYNGTKEIINARMLEINGADYSASHKVDIEAKTIVVPSTAITSGKETTLPLTGSSYSDVTITWESQNTDILTIDPTTGDVTVNTPTVTTLVKLIATVSHDDSTNVITKEFDLNFVVKTGDEDTYINYSHKLQLSEFGGKQSNVDLSGATTYSYTCSFSDVIWELTATLQNPILYIGSDSTKGVQLGSGTNPFNTFSFETTDLTGKASSVIVNASTASKATATVSVYINGTLISTQNLSTTATDYTFAIPADTVISSVRIEISQTTAKGLYVNSIAIA